MEPSYRTLRGACKRYGPGRLPNADRPDIGAGYAAASAAFVATVLYSTTLSIHAVLVSNGDWIVSFLFPTLGLPIVVPSAFFLGVVGWRLLPTYSSISGMVAGGLGAIATYLVSLVLVGVVIAVAAALSLSGATPVDAAVSSVGLVAVAFVLTWWITIPVGCLSGLVYVNVTESAS